MPQKTLPTFLNGFIFLKHVQHFAIHNSNPKKGKEKKENVPFDFFYETFFMKQTVASN